VNEKEKHACLERIKRDGTPSFFEFFRTILGGVETLLEEGKTDDEIRDEVVGGIHDADELRYIGHGFREETIVLTKAFVRQALEDLPR
jgi:hypothetical protein